MEYWLLIPKLEKYFLKNILMKNLSNQKKGSLLAFTAVFFITPDSLFIRLSNIDTWGMLFYRGAIPFFVVFIGLLIVQKSKIFHSIIENG